MTALDRLEARGLFPELFDWLESPFATFRASGQAMRVENYVEDGDYVIRAELPGIDPDKDIEITCTAGTLRIHAERRGEKKEAHRSEFHYGALTRTLALPAGTDPDSVKATYAKGVLTVRVPMSEESKPETRRIAIQK